MASQLSFSQFTPVAISPHAPLQSTPFEDVVSTSSNSSGSSPGGSSPNSSSNESSKDESESSATPSNPNTESDDSESCNRLAIVEEEEDIEVIDNSHNLEEQQQQKPQTPTDKPLFTPYSTATTTTSPPIVPSAPMLSAQQLNTLRQFNQNHSLLQVQNAYQQHNNTFQLQQSQQQKQQQQQQHSASPKPQRECGVCSDKATGLHHGIISCEGCKGFFKRAITNKRIYRCVQGDEGCQMSRKDRNRCQFCRLKKCLHVGMNRKAIREDGMPGGRNKYTGPVNYSPEEVGGILNGSFYSQLSLAPPSSASPPISASSPSSSGSASKPVSFVDHANRIIQGALQTKTEPFALTQQSRVQKRRRSLASDQAGVPQAKIMASDHRAGHLIKQEQNSGNSQLDNNQSVAVAQSVIDRLHNAESKDLIDMNTIWPSFKAKEKLSFDELYDAFPKIAENSFTSETAWLRRAGLIETVGIVDFFTLLSQSWQSLALIRLLRKGEQLEHFNSVISKYDTPAADSTRIVEIFPLVLRIAQLYTRVYQLQITDREFSVIKVLCVMNTDVAGLESQKVAELKNLYLLVSNQAFGGQRTLELLQCLQDIRRICDDMKKLELNMMIFLIRVASTTCREILLKNKEETASTPMTSTAPSPKSYDSSSLHSSNNDLLKADENESCSVAPLSPVIFSPATKILNASLSLNLARQMKKEEKQQNNNDSVLTMSTNSSSNSSTPPPPSSSPDNITTPTTADGLPSYVLNNKKQIDNATPPQLQPHLNQSVNNPLYQNIMAKLAQERLMQHQRYPSVPPLMYQTLCQNQFLNHYQHQSDTNEDEEIDVDA